MDNTQLLKSHGLKKTSARMKLLALIQANERALAFSEVETELGSEVDRVTLYRTIGTFESKGIIHKVFGYDGVTKYNLCNSSCEEHQHHDNHLHFHCRKCGKTTCIESVEVPQVNGLSGFEVQDVYMVANGICKHCAQN